MSTLGAADDAETQTLIPVRGDVDADGLPAAVPDPWAPFSSMWPYGETPYDRDLDTEDPDAVVNTMDVDIAKVPLPRTMMAPRIGHSAVAWALSRHSWSPSGMCQQFTRSAFGVGAFYGTAAIAWAHAVHRHPGDRNPPSGVPVFYTGGSRGAGHAAVSLGGGLIRSTDWPYSRSVATAYISSIERSWGLRYAGWTEDINRIRVFEARPFVHLSNVVKAAQASGTLQSGVMLKAAVASEVGRGTMVAASPILGAGFRRQYALVQRKYLASIGAPVTPGDADGIPGSSSLRWLGGRHGFDVKA